MSGAGPNNHALRLASGRYLIEDRPVVYAPSAALMMHARLHRRSSKPTRFNGRQGEPTSSRSA
jgi:hypothetical protein